MEGEEFERFELKPEDIEIDTYRDSFESYAVATHSPTGITAQGHHDRSMMTAKRNALRELAKKLEQQNRES